MLRTNKRLDCAMPLGHFCIFVGPCDTHMWVCIVFGLQIASKSFVRLDVGHMMCCGDNNSVTFISPVPRDQGHLWHPKLHLQRPNRGQTETKGLLVQRPNRGLNIGLLVQRPKRGQASTRLNSQRPKRDQGSTRLNSEYRLSESAGNHIRWDLHLRREQHLLGRNHMFTRRSRWQGERCLCMRAETVARR